MTPDRKKKLALWIIGVAAACILIFLGVQNMSVVAGAVSWVAGLIMPLILGCAFALILNVPMRYFESHLWSKTKKPVLCSSISIANFLFIFCLAAASAASASSLCAHSSFSVFISNRRKSANELWHTLQVVIGFLLTVPQTHCHKSFVT